MLPLLRELTPAEYFKGLVDAAMVRQHVDTGEFTSYYIVNLLCRFVRPDARISGTEEGLPLAIRLKRALESDKSELRVRLRDLGDVSLFVSGFFSDSFRRRSIDVDYYISMGEYAYGTLSRHEDDAFADVFGELSAKFVCFMDILEEVSDYTELTSCADDLRLYEKFLRTGSRRDAQKLIERGIVPNLSIGKKFIQ